MKRIWTTGTEFKRSYERELKALLEFSKPKYKESAVFVEFLGWFEDLESVYLAMEYLPLGDLEDNILAVGGSIKEEEVREIAVQVLEGLRIMHLENFAHRDLKPKNVLVCQGPPNWWVKLADFGLSKRRTDETGFRTQTGTFAYMAPEVLNYIPDVDPETSEYTNAVDMWALGCIVYRLVCGVVPFPPGPSLVKFCVVESEFPPKIEELTGLGQSFVKGLIVPYPSRRLTAQQALDHPWTRSGLEASSIESQPISFGRYDTATHPGLQSHELKDTSPGLAPSTSKPALPKGYHAPTVEDEEEETGSDTQNVSVDDEEREPTMRSPPAKSKKSKISEEIPTRRSPQQLRDPYINIVEPPAPQPAPLSRKKPSRSRTQGLDPYIIEPPSPPLTVPKKLSFQTPSSAPPESSLPREKPNRSKTQDYPRSEDISRLPRAQQFRLEDWEDSVPPPPPRAQTFTRDQVPPLPRAQTFQAGDRGGSRVREEYTSSESDSDTPIYTTHGTRKAVRYYAETPERPKNPESTRYIIDNGRSVPVSRHRADLHDLKETPNSSRPRSSRNLSTRNRESRPPPVRSREENLAAAAAYQADVSGPTVPLTSENLRKLGRLYPSSLSEYEDDEVSTNYYSVYIPPNGKRVAGFWDNESIRPSEAPSAVATAEKPSDRPIYYADENGFIEHSSAREEGKRKDPKQHPRNFNLNPFSPSRYLEREKEEHAKQVLEWQENVARTIAADSDPEPGHPLPGGKASRQRRHKTESAARRLVGKDAEAFLNSPPPEPIIHASRPKMSTRRAENPRREEYEAWEAMQYQPFGWSNQQLPIASTHPFAPAYPLPRRYPPSTGSDDGW